MRVWFFLMLAGCSFQEGGAVTGVTGDGGKTSSDGSHDAHKSGGGSDTGSSGGSDATGLQPATVVSTAFGVGNGASLSATLNATSHVGDVILVVVYGQTSISSVSDTAGDGYGSSLARATSAGEICGLYSARVTQATGSNTISATVGGPQPLLVAAEYTNVPQGGGALFDGSTETVTISVSTSISANITTSTADDTLVALLAASPQTAGDATPSTAQGFTAEGSAQNNGLVEDRVVSPNTYTTSANTAANAFMCLGLIALLAG